MSTHRQELGDDSRLASNHCVKLTVVESAMRNTGKVSVPIHAITAPKLNKVFNTDKQSSDDTH